jgi:kynurenine formamidase
MNLSFTVNSKTYHFHSEEVIDISLPLMFNGLQPNTYGVPRATAIPYQDGNFIGDVKQGSGCNFETYTLTPHCNGTHTECVGHISKHRITINQALKHSFIPSILITVQPQLSIGVKENYQPVLNPTDLIITKAAIENQIKKIDVNVLNNFIDALIIRTLPNSFDKKERDYTQCEVPFFTLEAMEYIVSLNVNHLLVDLPSIDRMLDEGKLSCHHIYWGVDQGSHDIDLNQHSMKTITEMIFVDDKVVDGPYVLNLQIAPFESDASPSRPLLYPINNIE